MLQQLLTNWPLIAFAQALGVVLAWGVDALSWTWRRDENTLYAINLLGGGGIAACCDGSDLWMVALSLWLLWLGLLMAVQAKQFKMTLRDAFFGLLAQSLCFVAASLGCWFIASPMDANLKITIAIRAPLGLSLFTATWLVSAVLTHLILSLFRPRIYGTWRTWRQNSARLYGR